MTDVVEIKCGKCQATMRVHKPLLHRLENPSLSQLTLLPAWSIEERKCKGCGAVNGPIFGEAKLAWVAFHAAEKPRVELARAEELEALSK